jgi:hypothetical protein
MYVLPSFRSGLSNPSLPVVQPPISWPASNLSLGSRAKLPSPVHDFVHYMNSGDCWRTDLWMGMKALMASLAITPRAKNPRDTPSVPWATII